MVQAREHTEHTEKVIYNSYSTLLEKRYNIYTLCTVLVPEEILWKQSITLWESSVMYSEGDSNDEAQRYREVITNVHLAWFCASRWIGEAKNIS